MTAKTKKWLIACSSMLLVTLVLVGSILSVSAATSTGNITINLSNPNNIPFDNVFTVANEYFDELSFGTNQVAVATFDSSDIYNVVNGELIIVDESFPVDVPDGQYLWVQVLTNAYDGSYQMQVTNYYSSFALHDITFYFANSVDVELVESEYHEDYLDFVVVFVQITDGTGAPTECPTLEEQIADYDGTWYEFEQMLKTNNYELWLKYSAELADVGSIQYSQGLTQGYQNGFMGALSGNNVEDPIDQYWNSTKDYVLIAGQPYFAPNGFGAIDAYNTIGIYGEHNSYLHTQDGTTQVFNGQYVTEFASAGTLGGGWYKIGATVGDDNAYEQSFNVSAMDKAYYVARVSPLGDPVEEFLVAIWLDSYEAWYVAEDYVHYGTVANNNKSYKQVYSIYMTDIRPTAQRFVNYDNPTLYESFTEDVNATLYLATFNQLNNYNVYTDDIGIVESYNNGFDAGANTTLWLDLLSQPIVAFFSIPLAQVIVEGVTYTLTYGIVLGAGIVALIVVWFLKLFAGG